MLQDRPSLHSPPLHRLCTPILHVGARGCRGHLPHTWAEGGRPGPGVHTALHSHFKCFLNPRVPARKKTLGWGGGLGSIVLAS